MPRLYDVSLPSPIPEISDGQTLPEKSNLTQKLLANLDSPVNNTPYRKSTSAASMLLNIRNSRSPEKSEERSSNKYKCEECGKLFESSASSAKLCSMKCIEKRNPKLGAVETEKSNDKDELVDSTKEGSCEVCKKKFKMNTLFRTRKYCSGKCSSFAKQKNVIIRRGKDPKKTMVSLEEYVKPSTMLTKGKCKKCEKEFEYHKRRAVKNYCSRECAYERKKEIERERHRTKKTGIEEVVIEDVTNEAESSVIKVEDVTNEVESSVIKVESSVIKKDPTEKSGNLKCRLCAKKFLSSHPRESYCSDYCRERRWLVKPKNLDKLQKYRESLKSGNKSSNLDEFGEV